MKIKRVRFHGFGHWIDQTFTFHDGINLIEAPNEAGKSTLIQGIFALLYGRNKEGNYKKKQKAVWFEQFIPWADQNVYGGEIDYIVDQEIYRLIRSFHDDDQQLVKWKTGEDITESFAMDQKKERLFLESQIGLSGEMMKSICFIPFMEQLKPKEQKENQLAHKLTSLMRRGEELNIYAALQFLNKQINRIGVKQNGIHSPYGRAKKKIKKIEQRIDQLERIQEQVEQDEEQLKRLIQKEKSYDQELKTLRKQKEWAQLWMEWDYLELQRNTYLEKLDRLHTLQNRLTKLKQKYQQLQIPAQFSEEAFEEYLQAIQNYEQLEQTYQNYQQQIMDIQAQIDQFITDNHRWLQLDLPQAQQMMGLLDQYKEMETKADQAFHRMLEQKDRYEQAEADIKKLKKLLYAPCSKALPRFWFVISFISGVFSLGLILMNPFISAILAIIGMASLSMKFFLQRRERKKKEQQRQRILDRWGVETIFDLYRKQEEIELALNESGKKIEQRMEHIRQQVKQWLEKFDSQTLSFDPDQWKLLLKSYMQKAKEKKKWLQSRESRMEYLNEEKQRIRTLLLDLKEKIKREKEYWGVDRLADLRRLKQKFEMKQQLQAQIEALQSEVNQTEQIGQIEDWHGKCKQIEQKLSALQQKAQGAFCYIDERAMGKERSAIASKKEAEFLELKREIAKLRGSLNVRYQQLEELSDLEMERKKWQGKLEKMEQEREVLQLAYQTLAEARKRVEENIAPRLKPFVSKWIAKITNDRYQECNLLPDQGFDLYFFEPKTGKSIPVSYLSRGTVDQMYFALRLAIVQFYSEQRKGVDLPLFLDDSFAHFDNQRLRAMLKILHQFAKRHQIFLCTCHDRERRMMEQEGIPFRAIQLVSPVTSSA